MLAARTVPVGMQCFTGDHTLIEVMGASGFDYVWLDTEHSPLDPRRLEDTIRTCEVAGLSAIVRMPEPADTTSARRALEAGAEGVVVPMVRSAADVQEVVRALTFPPNGIRGLCPALRPNGYSMVAMNGYMRESDEDLLIIPMIETVEGLEDIEAICAVPEVQVIVFAAGELAFAMGEGATMHSSAKVQQAQQRVFAAAKANGVAILGGPILDPSPQSCAKALDDGITMLCIGIDVMAFRQVCERTVGAANAAVAERPAFNRPAAPASGFPQSY